MLANLETVIELSARWRVPVSWVYAKTRETSPGAIPRVKIGKYLRFIPEEVDAWLLSREGE
jgi:predicted DNA-binding transcriptional regulator AlpA